MRGQVLTKTATCKAVQQSIGKRKQLTGYRTSEKETGVNVTSQREVQSTREIIGKEIKRIYTGGASGLMIPSPAGDGLLSILWSLSIVPLPAPQHLPCDMSRITLTIVEASVL